MTMRILVAIDLNDEMLAEAYPHDTNVSGSGWDDLCGSVDARVIEFFCGSQNLPVTGKLMAMCEVTGILRDLIAATEVGAEGSESADIIHGSLITFTQHLDAQEGI